jgi:hypothetical protein
MPQYLRRLFPLLVLVLLFLVAQLLDLSRYQQYHAMDANIFAINQLDDVAHRLALKENVPKVVGKEYSAKACWLEPAWGMQIGRHQATTSSNVCPDKKPNLANTTATHLTCAKDDEKPVIRNRNHHHHQHSPGLTIALLYYAKPAMLLRQLEHFSSFPHDIRRQFKLLIIDDGSPDGLQAREYILNGTSTSTNSSTYNSLLDIRLARITTQKEWNIGGARNLAFSLADTPTVLMLDLDTLVPLRTLQAALTWETHTEASNYLAHRFNRIRPDGASKRHPAVCLLDAAAYWSNGGCDEDFCGNYGHTDVHFWSRWNADPSRVQIDHTDTYLLEAEQAACDEAYISDPVQHLACETARANLTVVKELETNHKLWRRKVDEGCWSNDYLRFRWVIEK